MQKKHLAKFKHTDHNVNNTWTPRSRFNIMKAIYDKPTVYIRISSWKLKALPLNQEQDKETYSCHFYSEYCEVLIRAVRQGKEIKGIKLERSKISLFTDYILYTSLKTSPKAIKIMNSVKLQYKTNIQKIWSFYKLTTIRKKLTIPLYNCIKKSKVLRNKFHQDEQTTLKLQDNDEKLKKIQQWRYSVFMNWKG